MYKLFVNFFYLNEILCIKNIYILNILFPLEISNVCWNEIKIITFLENLIFHFLSDDHLENTKLKYQ